MQELFANDASTTLNNSGVLSNVALSMVVLSASKFPASGQFRVRIDDEIIIVGSVAGATFGNLVRGVEGTTAVAHNDGSAVTLVVTKDSIDHVHIPRFIASGVLGIESFPRWAAQANGALLLSGRLHMQAIELPSGLLVSSITFITGTTGAATPTHQIAGLFDDNSGSATGTARAQLGSSSDLTSAAWAASTAKTFTLQTPYRTIKRGIYYLGLMVVATTVPTLSATTAMLAGISTQTPLLVGTSSTALTTSLPNPAGAMTAGTQLVYCYVN